MEVVANDKDGALFRQVFPAFYLPEKKGEYEDTYEAPAKIVNPVKAHLVVIIAWRKGELKNQISKIKNID